MDLKTYKRKRKKKRVQHQTFELLDEIVWEIIIRLPVASLARFKMVSKAWLAFISDPLFIPALLRISSALNRNNIGIHPPSSSPPSFFWNQDFPMLYLPTSTSTSGVYKKAAVLQHSFIGGTSWLQSLGSCPQWHTDGLVLLPTNTKAYVFNLATRDDAIVLPESHRNMMMGQQDTCLTIGFSLDTLHQQI